MKKIIYILFLLLFVVFDGYASDYVSRENKSIHFSWLKDDRLCVYTPGDSRILFTVTDVKTDGNESSLSAFGWGVASDTKYYAFSPYSSEGTSYSTSMTAIPLKYSSQIQKDNANLEHLTVCDYMVAQTTSSSTACHFNYNHLGSIIRLECSMESTETLTTVTISAPSEKFITEATMNVTNNQLTPTKMSKEISLGLNNITVGEGNKIVAYLMVAPTDLSKELVEITLTTVDGKTAKQTFSAPNIKAGKCYPVTMDAEFVAPDNEEGDDSADDDVLAKKNTIVNDDSEDNIAFASTTIEFPTASAKDFDVDTEGQFEEYILLGDANSDGVVNTTDAVLVINYYLGKTTEIDKKAADINLDGTINTTDAVGIINKYLNK